MRIPLPLTILAGLALAACAGATSPTAAPTSAPTQAATAGPTTAATPPAGPPSAGATPPAGGDAVTCGASGSGTAETIQNFAFNPNAVSVASGSFITWTNNDNTTHTVTFDSGPDCGHVSGGGGTVTVKFSAPGTYAYHCSIHTSMKGTVTVTG